MSHIVSERLGTGRKPGKRQEINIMVATKKRNGGRGSWGIVPSGGEKAGDEHTHSYLCLIIKNIGYITGPFLTNRKQLQTPHPAGAHSLNRKLFCFIQFIPMPMLNVLSFAFIPLLLFLNPSPFPSTSKILIPASHLIAIWFCLTTSLR